MSVNPFQHMFFVLNILGYLIPTINDDDIIILIIITTTTTTSCRREAATICSRPL